jgi:hypothetical protein
MTGQCPCEFMLGVCNEFERLHFPRVILPIFTIDICSLLRTFVCQDNLRAAGGDMYDAIVIGARCAGAATAMLLARYGHRVLRRNFYDTTNQKSLKAVVRWCFSFILRLVNR